MLSVRITLEVFSSFDISSQEMISFTENKNVRTSETYEFSVSACIKEEMQQ